MPTSTTDKPCLVIGDCHGHLDRLESLLLQEGILAACEMCAATGDVSDGNGEGEFCPACDGLGSLRVNHNVCVVQLGDLGHFGQGAMADLLTYQYGDRWLDVVLWGNHDRAVITEAHAFAGYQAPAHETRHLMKLMMHEAKLKLAFAAHGFLMTHAGLHAAFKHNSAPEGAHDNPVVLAEWFNVMDRKDEPQSASYGPTFMATRDAIGSGRGGRSAAGGILWRDASEKLYDGFRQVFGHSAKPKVRTYETPKGNSYCVDIGTADNGLLAAIWLPDERIVQVDVKLHSSRA